MSSLPLVSILMPLFNKERYVEAAIHSALAQSHERTEVIVIDDGSTDESLPAALAVNDSRLHVHTRANRGANATRNELLERSNGEFVQYLDADDLVHPEKLSVQLAQYRSGCDVAIAAVQRQSPRINTTMPVPDASKLFEMLCEHGVHTSAPLHKKVHLESVGGWDERLAASQEYDLHLRLALAGLWRIIGTTHQPLSTWRLVDDSTSSDEHLVYLAKAQVLTELIAKAPAAARPPAARALANAGRHLARANDLPAAVASVRLAMETSTAASLAYPRWLRIIRHPEALVYGERLVRRPVARRNKASSNDRLGVAA